MVRPLTRWLLALLAVLAVAATWAAARPGSIEERPPTIDWPAARLELEAFDKANPTLGPEARDERQRMGALAAAMRDPYFRDFVERRFEPIVRERIRRRVVAPDSSHERELRWLQESAAKESLEELRREVRAADPAATDAEVARFWTERPRLRGAMIEVPWPVAGQLKDVRVWLSASVDRRVTYLFGRFVLESGLFELPPPPDDQACERCEGEGTVTYTLSNGGTFAFQCHKCHGRGHPDHLRYR
jgi:hypothetical protein